MPAAATHRRDIPPAVARRLIGLYRPDPHWPAVRGMMAEAHLGLVWAEAAHWGGDAAADLVGAGTLALLRVLDRFDCERAGEFAAAAAPAIRGAMIGSRRADRLGVGTRGRVGCEALLDLAEGTDHACDCVVDPDRLLFLVAYCLTDQQAAAVRLRFGLEGEESHTLEGVAERLGLTRGQVERRLKAGLGRLRRVLAASGEVAR